MITSTHSYFNKLAIALGNNYAACTIMAKSARGLSAHLPKYTIESHLLRWVVEGVPCSVLSNAKIKDRDMMNVEDVLEFVDDELVKSEVRKSYRLSLKNRHLTYSTHPKLDKHQKDRCDILLRMAWYSLME